VRPLNPIPVYYLLTFGQAFLLALVAVVNLVFQAEAGLTPLQLVLVGTMQEATIFLCEVPTGVVADVYSRRLSVLMGFVITGAGLVLIGSFARFETILIGSAVWGLGFTFISGALHAWISDEIGADKAAPLFVRGAQVELLARIGAIPVAVGIAYWHLNAPILIAGALLIVLALALWTLMPETGFRRTPAALRQRFSLPRQVKTSAALVSASPLLLTIFGIALFYGMTSEGFDRLWTPHFLRDLGLPKSPGSISFGRWDLTLEPIVWFGFIRLVGTFLALGASEVARRRLDFSGDRVPHWLFAINVGQALSLVALALAGGFWVGVAALWGATTLSRVYDPLYLGWLNMNVRSEVRATVLSMSGQADAFGQIAGGPVIGAIGSAVSLRTALVATAGAMLPALGLYLRAFRLGPAEVSEEVVGVAVASPEGDGVAGD
jgi:DHA3 family tetracycline resistance protein-like MFS transporter